MVRYSVFLMYNQFMIMLDLFPLIQSLEVVGHEIHDTFI